MNNLSELFSLVGKKGFIELNIHRYMDDRWFFSATIERKKGGKAHWYAYCETESQMIMLVLKGIKEEWEGRVDLIPSNPTADSVPLSDELELF